MKTIARLFIYVALLSPGLIFAQGFFEFFQSGSEIWGTFALSLAALIAAITEGTELIKAYTGANGTISKVISWSLGFVLAIVGNLLDLGIFAEASWVWTGILAVLATLSANGLFNYDIAKMILNFLTPRFHQVKS